jgi:hypothetical protein
MVMEELFIITILDVAEELLKKKTSDDNHFALIVIVFRVLKYSLLALSLLKR